MSFFFLFRNNAVTTTQKLLLALRFYATGSFLISAGDVVGVSKSTACVIVRDVSVALAQLRPQFIKMPETNDEIKELQKQFYGIAKFPLVIGAIDCTHIKIQSPGGPNAEYFRNRKGWFSLNVQTVVSAKLKIMDIVVRWPGSTHDSTIFSRSKINNDLHVEQKWGNSLIVADSGYANTKHIVTPFLNPQAGPENLYNESQIRTRNPVERCYGVLKRRFPVLSLGMRLQISNIQNVIIACSVLHNIAIDCNDVMPMDDVQLPDELTELINEPTIENRQNNARTRLVNEYFSHL
ncbi:putative nuclease HARBI1 [Acyrthosiphon pisum]|uniref:DDE Tnp4 domain-containing protein n=1 Tax=Acyrthosiphon pisum TaxID=7029 RepID=A0A8R2NTR5_ACYPI|nr:putative nuclease HARBI1 [Acyrthosiphon pisum]